MSSANSYRNNPVPSQATGDTQYNVRDAALRGASSAFSKPPVKPKPQINTYTGGNNGALLAATKVGTGTPRATTPQASALPLRRDWTGSSMGSRPNPAQTQLSNKSSSSSLLEVAGATSMDRTPSPSNIAARLAAARYSPMRPKAELTHIPLLRDVNQDERDVLPPAGSFGDAIARLGVSGQQPKKRRTSIEVQSFPNLEADAEATNDTRIPSTISLVKMFEQNRPMTPTPQRTDTVFVPRDVSPPVKSPKPQRKISSPLVGLKDDSTIEVARQAPPVKPKPKTILSQGNKGLENSFDSGLLRKDSLGTPPIKQKPAQLAAIKAATPRPKPPPQRGIRPNSQDTADSNSLRRFSTSVGSDGNVSSSASFMSAPETQPEEKVKPDLPPPRRSTKKQMDLRADVLSDSAVRPLTTASTPLAPKPRAKPSIVNPPENFSPVRPASAMGVSYPAETLYRSNYQRDSVRKITKHLTGESLSNAIVGAALASSRTASPAPSSNAPPPLPTRRHHHHTPFHRSPSPPKSKHEPGKLRNTMRQDPSSSSDEDESERYKRKGTRVFGVGRKHPNKHHEGSRKRWRDTITERERKRYEGVWAANKGLHIDGAAPILARRYSSSPTRSNLDGPSDPAIEVLNIVIKEIWMRSRLPDHVLEEVWDLVDGRGIGRLRREEFVVGLWLVDQRLKGRKLPVRISESVWASVRGAGTKVKVRASGGSHR